MSFEEINKIRQQRQVLSSKIDVLLHTGGSHQSIYAFTQALNQLSQAEKRIKETMQFDNANRENFLNWSATPNNVTNPFNVLKSLEYTKDQNIIFDEIINNNYKFITILGSARSGKTHLAGAVFLYLIWHKYLKKLEAGLYPEMWLDHSRRKDLPPFVSALLIAPSENLTKAAKEKIFSMINTSGLTIEDIDLRNNKLGEMWFFGGICIYIKTANKATGLVSKTYDVIWMDEAMYINEESWRRALAPRLGERDTITLSSTTVTKGANEWFINDLIVPGISDKRHFAYNKDKYQKKYFTGILHYLNNTFLANRVQDYAWAKDNLAPEIFEQEYEVDWRIKSIKFFPEFIKDNLTQDLSEDDINDILSVSKYVVAGVDISGGTTNSDNAIVVAAFLEYPNKLEVNKNSIAILYSCKNNYGLQSSFWIEKINELVNKYNINRFYYDIGGEREIYRFKHEAELSHIIWKPATKDFSDSIRLVKQLFYQKNIFFDNNNNVDLIQRLDTIERRTKKDGTILNYYTDQNNDLIDAFRYAVYSPFYQKLKN